MDLAVLEALLHQALLMEVMVVYQVVDQEAEFVQATLYLKEVMEVLVLLEVLEPEVMEVLNVVHRQVVQVVLEE